MAVIGNEPGIGVKIAPKGTALSRLISGSVAIFGVLLKASFVLLSGGVDRPLLLPVSLAACDRATPAACVPAWKFALRPLAALSVFLKGSSTWPSDGAYRPLLLPANPAACD